MSSSRRAGRRRRKARPTTGEGEAAQLEDFAHRAADLTLGSAQALCGQLGYKPVNLVRVGAFMWDNPDEPLVAMLYPLLSNRLGGRYDSTGNVLGIPGWRRKGARSKDGEEEQGVRADNEADPQTRERTDKPFPTMLWMTCPSLHARVCKLEDRGWIQKLDRRLQESPEHIAAIAKALDEVVVPAGRVIVEEGTLGREFYLIVSGSAAVKRNGRKVATISAGQHFGELALLDHIGP